MADEPFAEEIEEKKINEEYKIWKKNAPFLYDLIITHPLEWPSLTVQWLPMRSLVQGGDYAEHKLILGTHTSGKEDNYLCVANVKLPTEDTEIDARKYDEEKGELGGYGVGTPKVEIIVKMVHDHEVNRARHCPQDAFLIATKSPSADVLVYNWSKHPSKPKDPSVCIPQVRCKGHEKEGYGLSWSPFEKGKLVSAGDDGLVCLFDAENGPAQPGSDSAIAAAPSNSMTAGGKGAVVYASKTFRGHTEVVEDVAWHRHHRDLFASCGDDKVIAIWDVRDGSTSTPKSKALGHRDDVMTLSWNPFQEFLLLSGSSDKTVRLWDTRNLKAALHKFDAHTDQVLNVAWEPTHEYVFASSSADRRVFVWDVSKIGEEQSEEDAEDGPPELMFIHGGHTSKISDFGWSETDNWYIASVAEDNVLQIWQMAENICNGVGDDANGDKPADEDLE